MKSTDQAATPQPWAVLRCNEGHTVAFLDALQQGNLTAIHVDGGLDGLRRLDAEDIAGVALCADGDDPFATAATMCQLRLMHPTWRIVVLVATDDAASASVVLRHGGQPVPVWSRSLPSEAASAAGADRLRSCIEPSPTPTPNVLEALASAIDGHVVEAIADLARIGDDEAILIAVEELTAVTSSLLAQLERRLRYSVPVRFIVERFAPGAESDIDACVDMLSRAAVRRGVIDFDIDVNALRHGHTGVLFGAFNAAYGVVHFASDRWWRPAHSVLDDLLRGQHGQLHHLD